MHVSARTGTTSGSDARPAEPLYRRLEVEGDTIVVEPAASLVDRGFLHGSLTWTSDQPIDLARIPLEVLVLPFLWNVAPVVWVSGGRYEVPRLDRRVHDSLEGVRALLGRWYPSLAWSGTITAGELSIVDPPSESRFDRAVLFSGGVDSIHASLTGNPEQRTLLVSIWGAGIDLNNRRGWHQAVARAQEHASRFGMRRAGVRSNFRDFVDREKLNTLTDEIPGWWSYVQHGMALTATCAPLLYHHGIARVHIASTHTRGVVSRWGSAPELDEQVSLATASVVHDGYDLSRQEKLRAITDVVRQRSLPSPELFVCYSNPLGTSNCHACEKCYRTMIGLLVLGVDPRVCGFPDYRPALPSRLRRMYGRYEIKPDENELFMWQDIQRTARSMRMEGLDRDERVFVDWLREFDLHAYQAEATLREPAWLRLRRRMMRSFPAGYRAARIARRGIRRAFTARRHP